jgi:uncharacterized protein
VIMQMGGDVRRVVVTELRENTFYAVIEIMSDGQLVLIDSRPSDAIALALRVDCPIFIREEVLEASKRGDTAGIQDEEGMEEDVEWPEEIDDVPDYKM